MKGVSQYPRDLLYLPWIKSFHRQSRSDRILGLTLISSSQIILRQFSELILSALLIQVPILIFDYVGQDYITDLGIYFCMVIVVDPAYLNAIPESL